MRALVNTRKLCISIRYSATALAAGLLLSLMLNTASAQDAGPTPVPVEPVVEGVDASAPDASNTEPEVPAVATESTGIPTHPVEIIEKMNFWLVPFVIASVISVWFTIERFVVLRRSRVIPRSFVEPFLDDLQKGKLDSTTALNHCRKNESPVAAVFLHGVQKWGRPSVEVEQSVIDGGERQVSQLRRHLRVLNGVATVTPLLGLLGTVVGMIQAFNDIASAGAMGKADQLAAGIAMALLTTAFGLAIAIPSLVMYMYLSGRVEALVMEMDEFSQKLVRLVCAEGLASKPAQKSRPRPTPAVEKSEAVA